MGDRRWEMGDIEIRDGRQEIGDRRQQNVLLFAFRCKKVAFNALNDQQIIRILFYRLRINGLGLVKLLLELWCTKFRVNGSSFFG